MKREMMKQLVFTSWFALLISFGVSQTTYAEPHDNSQGNQQRSAVQRPRAVDAPLPEQYDLLVESIKKINQAGLRVKDAVDVDGNTKDLEVSISEKDKFLKWVETIKQYREELTRCAIGRDRSAEKLGQFIDAFVANLQKAMTEDPKDAKGLKEKHLLTFVMQIERYLEKKKALYPGDVKDFEKSDEEFLTQAKQIVKMFFGEVNAAKFTLEQQKAEEWSKPFSEQMDAIIARLEQQSQDGEKVCKVSKDKEDDSEESEKEEEKEDDKKDGEDKKDGKEKKDDGKAAKENKQKPVPLTGNPEEGQQQQANGDQQQPGQEGPGADPGADPGVDPGSTFAGDPGVAFDPGAGILDQPIGDDLNLNDFLQRIADRLERGEDDQELALKQAEDAIEAAKDLANDIARQQALALEAQKANDLGQLANLAGKNGKNGAAAPPPPAPIPPIAPPPIAAGGGNEGGFPFPPPQPLPPEPLPPQGGMPFYMPPPSSSQPPLIIAEEGSRFEDEYIPERRRPIPAPRNPQAGGLLELVRLQQQLMYAQQQAMMYPGNVRLNVNTMASRLAGGTGGVPTAAASSRHNRLQSLTGARTGTTTGTTGATNPRARSSTVPASLQRGSLAR